MKVVALIEGGKPIIRVLGAPFAVNCMVRTAFFDRRQGAWVMPYGELHNLMNALSRFAYHFEDRVSSGISDGDELLLRLRSQTLSDSYEHKTKPFAHQVEGFYYGMACPNFLLADEQGLGKTKQAIDLAINRKKMYGIKHCLIVCGVSALRFNWKNEVSKHSDESALILGERLLRKGPKAGQLRLGGNKEKLEDAERLANGDDSVPFFVITNIESLRDSTEKVEGKKKKERIKSPIRDALERASKSGLLGMIVFDEFHRVRDPTTLQGSAILSLRAPYEMAMTGTPVLNTPLDLYTALAWLGVERHSYYQFRAHYCYLSGHTVTGYKHQEDLRKSLLGHMLRRKKEEVLDLPPKIYTNELLEMEPQQEAVYNEVKEEIMGHLVDIYLSPNPLTMMVRLRQATGFPGIVSESVTESVKLTRMREIVEDCASNGKKCVVFTNWTSVSDRAKEVLSDFNPAMYTGEQKDYEAEAEKERFFTDQKCWVLIGTIPKMGVGLTLTAATTCIFLDEPWNRGTKEQCEDRLHRIGTIEPVNVITLMCRGTIDERINEIVYNKGVMADFFVDGKIPKKENVKQAVKFLLS